jgi:hypothetical protein
MQLRPPFVAHIECFQWLQPPFVAASSERGRSAPAMSGRLKSLEPGDQIKNGGVGARTPANMFFIPPGTNILEKILAQLLLISSTTLSLLK